jgi:hypothetical protein
MAENAPGSHRIRLLPSHKCPRLRLYFVHSCTITMIGWATMNYSFVLSILRPLARLPWVCSFIFAAVLCGGAVAQHLDNGILVLNYFPDTGQFSVLTSNPTDTVFYPSNSSFITVRDYTHGIDYDNWGGDRRDTTTGKLSIPMGAGSVVALSDRGIRTTWALPNFTVVQEVEILGSTFADTSVRQQVSVQNTGNGPLAYGIRYLWNWRVAGNSNSFSRPRFPDGAFTNISTDYGSPNFQVAELTDSLTNPSYSVFASVQGGALGFPATRPDRLAVANWGDFALVPWDYPVTDSSAGDSAIVYFWGYNTPLTLAPGSSSQVRQYVSTVASALGVTTLTRTMTEYVYGPLGYYFITSRDNEKQILDSTGGWSRTGNSFNVLANDDPGSKGITRYYFDKVALGGSRGSHFYTLVAAEKNALQSLNPTNAQLPGKPYDEGIDSFAYLPAVEGIGGSCAPGLQPLYRAFRGPARFPDDANHRFTTNIALYNVLVGLGWDGEGVKACLPQ